MASYVVVGDDVGNYKYYYTADLQTLGFPTQLHVTRRRRHTTWSGEWSSDVCSAVLTTTSYATVNVTSQVTDDLSGVLYADMYFVSPSGTHLAHGQIGRASCRERV